jgi:hypothetical protein
LLLLLLLLLLCALVHLGKLFLFRPNKPHTHEIPKGARGSENCLFVVHGFTLMFEFSQKFEERKNDKNVLAMFCDSFNFSSRELFLQVESEMERV